MAMGTATGPLGAEDDWEVVNDDGFVYKRKRRRLDLVPGASIPPVSAPDPAEEERCRRERKRGILVKLKKRYRREVDQWEGLANRMKEMEEESVQYLQERERERDRGECFGGSTSGSVEEKEGGFGSVVDELLRKVEAQEAMIRDISNLCDVAEAMCKAEDERLTQYLIDLPIWASPGELMASLCDERTIKRVEEKVYD